MNIYKQFLILVCRISLANLINKLEIFAKCKICNPWQISYVFYYISSVFLWANFNNFDIKDILFESILYNAFGISGADDRRRKMGEIKKE